MRVGSRVRAVITAMFTAGISPQVLPAQVSTCGWHFLEAVSEPPAVQALVARVNRPSHELNRAVQLLQSWFLECDASAAREAAQLLGRLAGRSGFDSDVISALHGIALLRGPEVQIANASGLVLRPARFGSNAERTGVRLLLRVLLEKRWPEIADELAEVGFATRSDATLNATASVLRQLATETGDSSAEGYWALLSEVDLVRGDFAQATENALRAERGGDARGARVRGIALLLSGSDPDVGGSVYMGAIGSATGPLLHRYFDDVRGVLDDEELRAWAQLDVSARGKWLRDRWEWRALLAGLTANERLAEHHRRLHHTTTAYRKLSYRGAPPPTAVWRSNSHTDLPFDDRGVLFLRHGTPDREWRMVRHVDVISPRDSGRLRPPSSWSTPPQRVAWGYHGLGGTSRVFEFDRATTGRDYFLAEPVAICDGKLMPSLGRPNQGYPVAGDLLDWAAALHSFDPALSTWYVACSQRDADELPLFWAQARLDAVRHAEEAWATESAVTRYTDPLSATLNLYSFHRSGGSELIGYFAVVGGRLAGKMAAHGTEYSLRMLLSVGSTMTGNVSRADTTVTFVSPDPLTKDARLGMVVPLPIPRIGEGRVTATVTNVHAVGQGRFMTTALRTTHPPHPAGLSDIVIAEDRDGAWRRGQYPLAPIPGHAVRQGDRFRVFHELYGAAAGDSLRVTLTIAPVADVSARAMLSALIRRRGAMTLSFVEEASPESDGTTLFLRTVAADLVPGSYTLQISISNSRTEQSVEQSTALVIIP
jgi:hypothetical protein